MFFVCQQKFSEKHKFVFDRLIRLLAVQILEVTVYQENAEHIRLITLHRQSEKVEMGGTCLGEQKSIQQKVVFNSCKLCYYTVWYRNNLKTKPTYWEKNLLDYLFGGFRSTLKW